MASKLNCHIELLKPVKTSDGQGGASAIFEPFCAVWAEFLSPRFREAQAAGAVPLIITQGIRIRRLDGVKKGFKVRHCGREFDVIHVEDRCRAAEMILTCKELDFC